MITFYLHHMSLRKTDRFSVRNTDIVISLLLIKIKTTTTTTIFDGNAECLFDGRITEIRAMIVSIHIIIIIIISNDNVIHSIT